MRRLVLLVLLLALPARAETPAATPSRDVDVTYRMAGDLQQRMRWDVTQHRLRIDPPLPDMFMLVDTAAQRMTMVNTRERSIIQLPSTAPVTPAAAGATWQRLGPDSVAGQACTTWRTQDVSGHDTEICLTADGVMLRASGPQGVLVEAVSVRYAPADKAAFDIPAGYKALQPQPAPQAAPKAKP